MKVHIRIGNEAITLKFKIFKQTKRPIHLIPLNKLICKVLQEKAMGTSILR